ncbi:MAG: DUF4062 domain-containing protein [Planctomycetota bacterium]
MTSVFLSSVMSGMEEMRAAAVAACDALDISVTKAEDFSADPSTPRGVCLRGVGQANGLVLLLGERYGSRLPSGKSPTEEEFDEAVRLGKEVFVFRTSDELEPEQETFLERVGSWQGGQFYRTCTSATELQRDIVRALRAWSSAPSTQEVDALVRSNLARVTPQVSRGFIETGGPWLSLSWSPNQRLFLDDDIIFEHLPEAIGDKLVAGPSRLLRTRPETSPTQDGLRVRSADREPPQLRAWIGSDASVSVGVEIEPDHDNRGASVMSPMFYLPPDQLAEALGRQLAFVGEVLREVDPDRRCTAGRLQASLARMGMRTIGEATPGQSSFQLGTPGDADRDQPTIVPPDPVTVARSSLAPGSEQAGVFVKRFRRLLGGPR